MTLIIEILSCQKDTQAPGTGKMTARDRELSMVISQDLVGAYWAMSVYGIARIIVIADARLNA